MSQTTHRAARFLPTLAVYSIVAIAALGVAVWRSPTTEDGRAAGNATPNSAGSRQGDSEGKPFFSLSTGRTYASDDRARLWVDYRGVEELDFRVYRVNDPVKFFRNLDDPHRMGEDERSAVAATHRQKPSVLEQLRAFKSWFYTSFRTYVRRQLRRESRRAFNVKFRDDGTGDRLPLNVADYARVSLLNPDQLVSSWRQRLAPLENEYDRRMISLGKREPGVYLVEAVGESDLRAYTIAIVTDLTMISKTTKDGEVMVYAVHRKTGAPRAGVRVEVVRGRRTLASGVTDKSGILRAGIEKETGNKPAAPLAGEEGVAEGDAADAAPDSYLIMTSERDNFAISDLDSFYFGGGDEGEELSSSNLIGYVYTDRPVYRPAQKVYFKGVLRRRGDAGYEMIGEQKINVTVEDPNGGKIFERVLSLSPRGTFNGEVEIAGEAPLGNYRVIGQIGEETASSYFEVEEYKKPEYKVNVSASQRFVPIGAETKFSIEARYFFGAPVADAEVKYYIYRSRHYHSWLYGDDDEGDGLSGEYDSATDDEGGDYGYGDNEIAQEGEGALDERGRMSVSFRVPEAGEKDSWDYSYRLEAQVTDASRRTIQGSASFTGTRGPLVAYAAPERYVYTKGDTARIVVKAGDYEGHPVAAKVTLQFVERHYEKVKKKTEDGYEYDDYEARERELEKSAEVMTNAEGAASYDYPVPVSGSIYVKAVVAGEGGREVVTHGGSMWVADEGDVWSDYNYEQSNSIKIVPDKKSYRPGETAHVLVMLPNSGGSSSKGGSDHGKTHLLVTTELQHVLTARHVEVAGRTVVIDVPIEARYAPNVYLGVTYIKDNEMYSDERALVVPARDRMLNVEIIPHKKEYKPRESAVYTILARNADGSPATGAEVSVGVVDEAIYSIRPDSAGDIRRAFYGRRYNEVETHFSNSYWFTGYAGDKPMTLAARRKPSYQLADFKGDGQYAEPTVRKEFKDTAFWQPDAVTGADGKAIVEVRLPDNLTTWRATARAVTADTRVGAGVQKVLARKDLILRVETPRFLTEGDDTVTISGIVHNFLPADAQARISLEVNGAELLGPSSETVMIPKRGQHRVDWRIAARNVGRVTLLAKALTAAESDAVEMSIEILPRGLHQTEGRAVTLSGDNDGEQTVSLNVPANSNVEARTLRIETSPSIAGALFGALDYLTGYPYGCTEQTMSRFLPTVIVANTLRDVQTATIKEGNNINAKVERGLDRLYGFQHADGGWGWWKTDPTDPFMTAYVVDGLTIANRAGYAVDTSRVARGREKLRQMIDAGKTEDDKAIDLEARAYMIYALNESGEGAGSYLDNLFAKRGELQPYGRALLAVALKHHDKNDERARVVAAEIERTAITDSGLDAHWQSNRRSGDFDFVQTNDIEATAMSLKALAQIAPQSPLLAKAARWLVTNRQRGGYWLSTKQTAFAIYGLTDYLKVSRELSPDYTVEVYLNGEQVLSRRVEAADVSSAQNFVLERKGRQVGDASQLRVVKRGRGSLYVAATLDYFTNAENLAAKQSKELRLTREYLRLRVTEKDGKASWGLEPLAGEIRSGDFVVARLRVEGARAQYLMIEDPIPAGCEQIERVSGINLNYNSNGWSDWYSAREFRDEKTVIFVNYFDGDATFQYAMRVQVPGEFRIAAARAELMYRPTVESNTATGGMQILERK